MNRPGRSLRRWIAVASTAAMVVVGLPSAASATAPAKNGRIAFQGLDEQLGRQALFVMAADGSHRRQLTSFPSADIESPDWSPDGSRIAFDSDLAGGIHVFRINPDGSDLTQVTNGSGSEFTPGWSPDGVHLAVEHAQDGEADGLFVLDLRSRALKRLTANPYGLFDTRPQYSPDGRKIVFTRLKQFLPTGGALSALFVVDIGGHGLRRLTSWSSNSAEPDWSPDGRTIVYNDFDDRIEDAQVFVVDVDGTHRRQLTDDEHASAFRPCWSPSGRSIVFTRITFGPGGAGPLELFTMNADGRHVTRLGAQSTDENEADWGPRIR